MGRSSLNVSCLTELGEEFGSLNFRADENELCLDKLYYVEDEYIIRIFVAQLREADSDRLFREVETSVAEEEIPSTRQETPRGVDWQNLNPTTNVVGSTTRRIAKNSKKFHGKSVPGRLLSA